MTPQEKISKILGVTLKTVLDFEKAAGELTGRAGVMEKVLRTNDTVVEETLQKIHTSKEISAAHIRGDLQKIIFYHEKLFLSFLEKVTTPTGEFEKAAWLAKSLSEAKKGFFLKKDRIADIFRKCPPENLIKYLGYSSVNQLVSDSDLTEAFSALRFIESDEWMHKTFDEAYSGFTADDFEEREIEIKVLSPKWHDIAKRFVEKKHHNVSHLKEFGVIFLNPIKMDIPGKFLRDFALLLHYFHEIEFYSRIFKKYSLEENFAEKFKSLLRGDVKELTEVGQKNAWLIIQRYLVKDNPQDPRLFLPRVNPESIHWIKAERDLVGISRITNGEIDPVRSRAHAFGMSPKDRGAATSNGIDLGMWLNTDWVGGIFPGSEGEEVISFDLEDNAMSLVSIMEGKNESFTYHQREAMWTKIFAEYVGGEEKLEQMIMENLDKGFIKLTL